MDLVSIKRLSTSAPEWYREGFPGGCGVVVLACGAGNDSWFALYESGTAKNIDFSKQSNRCKSMDS